MPAQHETLKLAELFKADELRKVVLPDFQRTFVWSLEQQKGILASLLAGIPIGTLLLLEGSSNDYAARALGRMAATEPADECSYLLDGQQRISCLRSVLTDAFSSESGWAAAWDDLYAPLRYRWFLRVRPEVDSPDVLGWDRLRFDRHRVWEHEEFQGQIHYERILKGKQGDWFHPAYAPTDDTGKPLGPAQVRVQVAKQAAARHLVPLWEILSRPDDGLHQDALRYIADERVELLRSKVADNELSLTELLSGVTSDALEIIQSKGEVSQLWQELKSSWRGSVSRALTDLGGTEIAVIKLSSDEVSRAIGIFEQVNRGGTPLSTYDLVVARYARSHPAEPLSALVADRLSQEFVLPVGLWAGNPTPSPTAWNALPMGAVADNAPSGVVRDYFLNTLAVLSHLADADSPDSLRTDHLKRQFILSIKPERLRDLAQPTATAVSRALCFLQARCGIVTAGDLRYKLMLVPIAVLLSKDEVWTNQTLTDRLEYWYWCSVFGGAYRERQNEQVVQDLGHLWDWLMEGKQNPFAELHKAVFTVQGYSDDPALIGTDDSVVVGSTVEGFIVDYVLSKQPQDLLEKQRVSALLMAAQEQVAERHHIIPLAQATTVGESTTILRQDKNHILNRALNLTYVLKSTNRKVAARPLADYLSVVEGAAPLNHFVPEDPQKHADETDDKYYERVLQARLTRIKGQVLQELDQLIAAG